MRLSLFETFIIHSVTICRMSNVIEVNGSLSQWVNSSEKKLVVIDFFATWYPVSILAYPVGAVRAA